MAAVLKRAPVLRGTRCEAAGQPVSRACPLTHNVRLLPLSLSLPLPLLDKGYPMRQLGDRQMATNTALMTAGEQEAPDSAVAMSLCCEIPSQECLPCRAVPCRRANVAVCSNTSHI